MFVGLAERKKVSVCNYVCVCEDVCAHYRGFIKYLETLSGSGEGSVMNK